MPGSPDPANTDTGGGVPHERIYVFTHARTHSTLNGGGVETERTGSVQMALAWARRRDKGSICPGSGSHRWPPNRVSPELEEQEVLTLSEESVRVQLLLFKKSLFPPRSAPRREPAPVQAVLEAGAGQGLGEGRKAEARKCPGQGGLRHSGCQESGGGPLCGPAGPASERTLPTR